MGSQSLARERNRLGCVVSHNRIIRETGAMAEFFRRALSNLLNEQAVKTLANNKAFQNFALRTHLHVEQTKKTVAEMAQKDIKPEEALPAFKHIKEFGQALKEEFQKDLRRFK
ncbi:hypothetical protein AaE_006955 [Aphanomyces astaci]|uniref:Uncharacterized protein n=1 Tax=Aphanomyces astaci TaxID=112090 RepID=A0A6A5ABP0_APHAT|nr:hypothetical protein AaE_006955 [Aphanomyces astaci]